MAEKNKDKSLINSRHMIGSQLSFSAAEAYKMLRTNLMFSFPADEQCHVIGVTSTYKGEGKSITSINLAYTLAEAGKKILLIEGDMRLPVIAGRLRLKSSPGLSNLMVEVNSITSAIQHKMFQQEGRNGTTPVIFDVITAGSIPPNPSELMQSERMAKLFKAVKDAYDYIVLDLPPLTVVSDALIASRFSSGLLITVRNEVASKKGVANAVRLCNQADSKILGFVFTDADINKSYGKYYKKGYYK